MLPPPPPIARQVLLLIEAGADLDKPTTRGWTALMTASIFACVWDRGHRDRGPAIVQALLDAGANPLAPNLEGKNAVRHLEEVVSRVGATPAAAPPTPAHTGPPPRVGPRVFERDLV